MVRATTGRRLWLGILGLALALGLAGCMPSYYGPPPPAPSAPPPAPPSPPQVSRQVFYVTVNRLNLRACPGMDCPKISVLEKNEEVEKVGETDDWSQVRIKRDGRLGWVNTRYLSNEPGPAGPEAAPAPAPVPAPPAVVTPAPVPERPPLPAKPPVAEKPRPEEAKPAKPAKPTEAEEPAPRPKPAPEKEKPAPKVEKPAPAKPTPPPSEKPKAPPEPAEPTGRIRIM